MRIGVTGADGFIGSNLVSKLKMNHEVYCFNRSDGKDILNKQDLTEFVKDKEGIIHLAGLNRAETSDLFIINTLGTELLMEVIKEYNPSTKLIFISSFQVYNPKNKKTKEDFADPKTEYGLSKYLAEKIIKYYSQKFGIKSVILRLSNVYGPGCKPNYNSVISTFIHKIQNNETLQISYLDSARDFIYIKDVVEAIEKTLDYNSKFDIINICSGKLTTLEDIVNILKTFKNFEIKDLNQKEEGYLIGNVFKSKKYLKFTPKISIKEGLKETWKWFENEKFER